MMFEQQHKIEERKRKGSSSSMDDDPCRVPTLEKQPSAVNSKAELSEIEVCSLIEIATDPSILEVKNPNENETKTREDDGVPDGCGDRPPPKRAKSGDQAGTPSGTLRS